MTKEALSQERGSGRNNNKKKPPQESRNRISLTLLCLLSNNLSVHLCSQNISLRSSLLHSAAFSKPIAFYTLSCPSIVLHIVFPSCLPATFTASLCVQHQQSQRSFLPPYVAFWADWQSKFSWSCSIDVGHFFFLVIIVTISQQQPWEFVTLALLWATAAVQAIQLCRTRSKQEGSLHT